MKIKQSFLGLFLFCLLMLQASTAMAEKADFNMKYAPPFGTATDARVENGVRISYFTEQGTIKGQVGNGAEVDVDKGVHGGIFSLNLAMEDTFGFELKTIWRRDREDTSFLECMGKVSDCQTNSQTFAGSQVVIGLTPKYRFFQNDWFWGSVSLEVLFPINTGITSTKTYYITPGLQFYFDTGEWFGVEVDTSFLMAVADPEESPYVPGSNEIPDDDEKFIAGAYARVNFLLKIIGQHFIGLQVDETYWFHSMDSGREAQVRQFVSREVNATTTQDLVDLAFFSNNQLNIGGGYRVNLKIFEGGVGAFVAVTDRDKRPGWGVSVDSRFTF